MFPTYIILGITHETKDSTDDSFNVEQILTEALFRYYGEFEKPCIHGIIRIPENKISEFRMDDNFELLKDFIDNIIRCDEEE